MPRQPPSLLPWRGIAAFFLLLLITLGCTATARYKTLSFFFDGVPDPNAPTGSQVPRRSTSGQRVFAHQPFREEKCDACHLNSDDIFARAKVRPNACFDCHADVRDAYPIMHGPVDIANCNVCHAPHQSTQPNLLKSPSPRICVQCHDETLLGPTPIEHQDPSANCLTCHSGHGGHDRRFLKPDYQPTAIPTAVAPTTTPAGGSP